MNTSATSLTKDEILLLRDLSRDTIGPAALNTGRKYVAVLEDLVKRGLASAHRAHIGELDENAVYSITSAGIAELERHDAVEP